MLPFFISLFCALVSTTAKKVKKRSKKKNKKKTKENWRTKSFSLLLFENVGNVITLKRSAKENVTRASKTAAEIGVRGGV